MGVETVRGLVSSVDEADVRLVLEAAAGVMCWIHAEAGRRAGVDARLLIVTCMFGIRRYECCFPLVGFNCCTQTQTTPGNIFTLC